MNEIKCPHCGKVFQVDERGFADILRQVRTAEFDKEIAQREGMLQEQNAQAVKLAVAKAQQDAQAETAQRDARIAELETRLAAEKREREQAEKSSQIEHANELEAALSADHDAQNRIAKAEHERLLSDATAQRDAEIAALRQQISSQESAFKQQLESQVQQYSQKIAADKAESARVAAEESAKLQQTIVAQKQQLESQTQQFRAEKELAVSEARAAAERQRDELAAQVKLQEAQAAQERAALREKMTNELAAKDELIKYKDEEIARVKSGSVTYAVRDTEVDDKVIRQGDIMGIGDKTILSVGQNISEVTKDLIDNLMDDDSELISIYYGNDIEEASAEELAKQIEEAYPDADVELNYGGQPIYYYIVSVE